MNNTGTTTITSGGDIKLLDQGSSIGGKQISLTATGDIGQSVEVVDSTGTVAYPYPLKIDQVADTSATLLVTAGGAITIEEVNGDVLIDAVKSTSNQHVIIDSHSGIKVASGKTGLVQGGSITLDARTGGVGNSASSMITLESGTTTANKVIISATSDIFVEEKTGNLRVDSINSSGGDVVLKVTSGGLVDANNTQIRDERTYNQLKNGIWADLGLTVGTQANLDQVATASAKAGVDASDGSGTEITITAHSFFVGERVVIAGTGTNSLLNTTATITGVTTNTIIVDVPFVSVTPPTGATIEAGSAAKTQEILDSFAGGKELEYETYWKTRFALNDDVVDGISDDQTCFVILDGGEKWTPDLGHTVK